MSNTILLFMFAIVLSSCNSGVPKSGSVEFEQAISEFYVGLAALQVGYDQYALEKLKSSTELAAGEPAAWNNLGVLYLRQRDFEIAQKSLQTASDLASENAVISFNLAVLAQQNGKPEETAKHLADVLKIEPTNLKARYVLATEAEKQAKDKEALDSFEAILKSQPENLAALIETARLRSKLGDKAGVSAAIARIGKKTAEWPDEAQNQFEKLKASDSTQAGSELAFLRNVLLRVPEFRASLEAIKPSDTVFGEVITKPIMMDVPDFKPAEADTAIQFEPSIVGENANAGSFVFLNGEDPPAIAVAEAKETSIGESKIPFSFGNINQIAVFDFDYDFKNDIAYAGESGFKLFRQNDASGFDDVTAASGIDLNGELTGVWAFDFDNEGDLDLLVTSSDSSFVLRNNGNGSFESSSKFNEAGEIIDFEYADFDEDGDGDVFLLNANGDLVYFENQRGGEFSQRKLPLKRGVSAFVVADSNGDGRLDLNVLNQEGGLVRFEELTDGDTVKGTVLGQTGAVNCRKSCGLLVSDFDNNGANDVAVANGAATELFLGTSGGKLKKATNVINAFVNSAADLNGDGKLDFVGVDKDKKAVKLLNKSSKNYNWQIVRPKAAKTEGDQRVNTFGVGGEIETRAGLAVQKQIIQSPQVHFGLGNSKQADVIRVVWQNGYVQAEFDVKSNQTIAAEQRLKGSCPHLFAWNGKEFAHVKDAPPWSPALGLKINAQDTYGILQTEEWFKIPGEALAAKDGFYELRITGEYWEAYYIDNYRLLAVDHPVGTEVFTDERFSIPLPPLEVFTTEMTNLFKSAVDHNDKNVAEVVSKIDEKYLDGITRGRFQGVAEDHFVELEFPEDAPLDKKLWVVADGWVHPTDASINVQRGQGVPSPPKSLSIEVQDKEGNWKAVKENLGFPAGKMKTALLDMEGVFDKNPASRKIRLRTEMEIFWDKLAWAVAIPKPSNQTREIELDTAQLRHRGFSVIEKPDDSSPEVPDYSRVMTTGQRWRDLIGYYTRYGDIKELLVKTDDRYVLMNAGDEIVMRFRAPEPVNDGFKRDFVIIGNGWIKDGDLNSDFSKTVIPLPTQASNDYSRPPTTLEDDPVYQKNKADWINFHTRYIAPDRFRNALRGN